MSVCAVVAARGVYCDDDDDDDEPSYNRDILISSTVDNLALDTPQNDVGNCMFSY